jgi:hypothetical protein
MSDQPLRTSFKLQLLLATFASLLWLALATIRFTETGLFSASGLWWCLAPWLLVLVFWLKTRNREK